MRKSILLLFFVLFALSVSAGPVTLVYDHYISVNESSRIIAFNNFGGNETLNLTLEGINYDLIYDSILKGYSFYTSSTTEEDVLFNITSGAIENNTNFTTGYLRFRIPYNVTLKLFQDNTTIGSNIPYCNQLSSVFLVDVNDKSEFEGLNSVTTVFNRFMNSLPFFGDYTDLETNFVSDNVIFYTSPYIDCSATVTLYETGNYSVFLVGSKYLIDGFDSGFENPLTNKDDFTSNIVDLEFVNKENIVVSIFTSDFEISKIWVFLNIGKWLLVTVVPLLLIWLIKSGVLGALLVRVIQK